MQEEQLPSIPENEKPAIKPIKLRYRRFADRYLMNGMNATEAYIHVYKPNNPENAHSHAWEIVARSGVKEYIDKRLQELNEVNYAPEAIKSALSNKAVSAKRDSDSIRALELMARISGLLTDSQSNTQVNIINTDIMELAKRRLSERRKDGERQNVKIPESPQVIETKEVPDVMSYNNPYVPTLSESVLSINTDAKEGEQIDGSVDGDGIAGDEGSPEGTGSSTPTHPSK